MSGIILVCAIAMQFVYGVQGHADRLSWSMFVYGSKRICLHMFHILGVFSFMCQQHHYTELLQSHLERPTFFCLFDSLTLQLVLVCAHVIRRTCINEISWLYWIVLFLCF